MNWRNKIINKFYPDNQVITKWDDEDQWRMVSFWRYKDWTMYPFNNRMTREDVNNAFKNE